METQLIIEPGSDISKIQIINFILLPNSKKHFEGPPLYHLSQNPLCQNHRSKAFIFIDTMLDYMIQRGNIKYLVHLFNYCEDSFDIVMNKAADKEWIHEYQKQIGIIFE
ncbi:Hypothetical_protein [Hexamita inflata]|uniref:Hypothetical_protein n=1 Tax=Hexamita inflata TaxID=28002 RepID=A0AA86TMD0_9EUKA|nr:Hypothetical protein HINF_LOCUS10589 [Hexamita inflata]